MIIRQELGKITQRVKHGYILTPKSIVNISEEAPRKW